MFNLITPLCLLIAGMLLHCSREAVTRTAGLMIIVAAIPWLITTHQGRLTVAAILFWSGIIVLFLVVRWLYQHRVRSAPVAAAHRD